MADASLDPALLVRLLELRDHPEAKIALLVDLHGIEHADDPRFARSLMHYLESWVGPYPREVFRLLGQRVLVLAPPEAGEALERGTGALAGVLRHHGFGALHSALYDLKTDAERLLADLIPEGAGKRVKAATMAPPVSGATLGRLLEVERTLAGANVEPLLREETLWSFADPEKPQAVLTELAISLDELDLRLDLALHRNEWLRHEVGAMLDRGLLRHIARDRGHGTRRFSFDLHSATVLDDGFSTLVRAIPGEVRGRLTAELASWEVSLSPQRFSASVERLTDLGFGVALDRVPLDALGALDLAGVEVDFVKGMWTPGVTPEQVAAGVARFGAERLVLWRCGEPEALAMGMEAGVRLFQGHAADERAAAPVAVAANPPGSEGPGSEGSDVESSAAGEEPEEAPADRPGLFARLFRRGRGEGE